jgi:D-3-phosphoglycerate dehydrogenase
MLAESDVVTLHVPGGQGTHNIMNAETIAAMKPGSILINASRGTVVDIDALHQALVSGHLAGAALDVFPTEPKSVDEPLKSPLIGMPNVILTPHIGGSTQESQENIGREVAEKLVSYLRSGATKGAVNFPEVSYYDIQGAVRLLHVHRNVPGAMGGLNNILAQHGINITRQQLQTQGELGYAMTDLDRVPEQELLDAVRAHSSTVRSELIFPA